MLNVQKRLAKGHTVHSMMFIKNPIREKALNQSTGQVCTMFSYMCTRKQNCFCYSLTQTVIPKSVFRSLVSDGFVFRCGTDGFCFCHTAKKTLRVYGALVHIAPLSVCVCVFSRLYKTLCDMII